MWFNTMCFDFTSYHDLEQLIGYLYALDKLIDKAREVALITFLYHYIWPSILFTICSHHQLLCQQGLFVQKAMIVAPAIARMHCFLGRLKGELPPLQQKYLKAVLSEPKRADLISRFNLSAENDGDRSSNILVTSQLKEKRGPPQYQNHKPGKKQKSDTATKNNDEIDNIFGAF